MTVAPRFIPTLQETRSVEAVARYGSVSVAARELGLSQPTISYHIKKLEERWGAKLFRSKGRSLEPTEFLRSIIPEIRAATLQLEHIGHLVGSQYSQKVLSIAITPSLASIGLQPRLQRFLEMHPNTDVRIYASNRFLDLAEERIDVAIRLLPKPPTRASKVNNILLPVPNEKIRLICSPDYFARLAAGTGRSPKGDSAFFEHAQFIYEDETHYWPNYFSRFWDGHQPARRPKQTFNNADLVLQAAVSGGGLALLRDIYVTDALRDGRLVEPFDMRMECDRVFQFIAPETVGLTAAAYEFVTWFSKELKYLCR